MTPNETLDSLIHLYAQLAIAAPAISGMVLAVIGIAIYRAGDMNLSRYTPGGGSISAISEVART